MSESKYAGALAGFRVAYDSLFTVLATYPAERVEQSGACGVWSPKQLVAHLSGWVVEAHKRYDEFAKGDESDRAYEDFDTFNAASVDARSHLNWTQTVNDLRRTVAQFTERAKAVKPEQTEDKRYRAWLRGLERDCLEHTEELRQFAGL